MKNYFSHLIKYPGFPLLACIAALFFTACGLNPFITFIAISLVIQTVVFYKRGDLFDSIFIFIGTIAGILLFYISTLFNK